MKIIVLGSGMVGRAIALDLSKKYDVSCADISNENLDILSKRNPNINIINKDLLCDLKSYEELLSPFDLVISAVPGFMGYRTLENIILCRKNAADISFFPEDSSRLDPLAKEMGVTIITDCGVAPGMSNLILGRYNSIMKIDSFSFYVGGLPKIRTKPFEYKAPFSPIDVIEEYTRPARIRIDGKDISKPALSDSEMMEFPEVGTLEAFLTDGLRSLLKSFPHIPNMVEKTLRYPGHIDIIKNLKNSGFFQSDKILINGNEISPLEFSSKVLINNWKLGEYEREITIMKIVMGGEYTVIYDLYDEYDEETDISSMARTTGYTCTAMAELIIKERVSHKGVLPPEIIGCDENNFEFVIGHLQDRGVKWNKNIYFKDGINRG